MPTGTIPPWVYDVGTVTAFHDLVRKIVWDRKLHAENVPVTGVKGEVAGAKLEANALAHNFYGMQTEYGLFKHEITLNKLLEDRARDKLDRDVDTRITGLATDVKAANDLIATVRRDLQSTAADLRKTLKEGDKQLRKEVPELRAKVNAIQNRLLAADQTLHGRITTLSNKVTQVTRNADDRSKIEKARVKELDQEVRAGLRRVDQLQGSAKAAGRDIGILIDRVTALERALR